MCKPTTVNNETTTPRNVVIAGAGPAGLLLTALLLQRNQELPVPLYRVTLVDPRINLGELSKEQLKEKFRSWMLGLAGHGCDALRECHGLYEEYCQKVGIEVDTFSVHMGNKEFKSSATPGGVGGDGSLPENFIVDRNFIVAAIARFVKDWQENNVAAGDYLATLYEHKLMYVDYENRRVLVRNNQTGSEDYMPYDLLVGCDGVRSVVREALIKRHSNFEVDVGDIFQCFKAVHVQRPATVEESSMHALPACFPNMQGIALPETGDMLNISVGAAHHLFEDGVPAELKSDDPEVVAAYVKENLKCFELTDYDDFARQWVNQRWNRTGQVHCNFYHSTEINVVIMGDAAHATSPSIGMGMNQALRDAQVFYQLLQQHKDDLNEVLPAFSERRVKEGNALTDLAMHLYCLDTQAQMVETIHMIVRGVLNKIFPKFVSPHPQAIIGLPEVGLSDVYDLAHRLGVIGKHRRINQEIRQAHFELESGMVKRRAGSNWTRNFVIVATLVATGAAVYPKMF